GGAGGVHRCLLLTMRIRSLRLDVQPVGVPHGPVDDLVRDGVRILLNTHGRLHPIRLVLHTFG
ncbi:hypothetical protein PENTCL1PPCAC_4228, partial [Pristionchus entomophagus]